MTNSDDRSTSDLLGGGIAGDALRATDWTTNPLGPIAGWPISLKSSVRAMLGTRQATCIFWGPELINLYNDGFIPLLGEKHPTAMGQRAKECWSDAWPVVGELLAGVVERGDAVLFDEMSIPIVRAGRLEDAWWNYSYSPLYDDGGRIAGVLVVATETTLQVTARNQLEAATMEAERARAELHGMFSQSPLPMALLRGAQHRFTLVNAPYLDLVGREVIGKSLWDAFSQEEVGYYRPYLDSVLATGKAVTIAEAPLRLIDREGVASDRFIDVGYHAYRTIEGRVDGVIAVIVDVTDKVTARRREGELRERAEAANRAKDEFLATMSHELRTPLTSVLGWARMLQNERDPARLAKGLGVIARNAEAQTKLIDDILDVSRIVSGKIVLAIRELRLASVVQSVVEALRPAVDAQGVSFDVVIDDAEATMDGDEDRLRQVVWNLLSNALKFTPRGGWIRVSTATSDSLAVLRVQDNGKGVAPDFLPFVFERFRQADTGSTKRSGGLGLGLAIVRHFVELHGGTISASSDGDGCGATFEVVLPRRHADAIAPVEPTSKATSVEGGVLSGILILIVDDDEDGRELVATICREAGATVIEACSAAEARPALAVEPIAVVVSDVSMPDEDGHSLIRWLRAAGPPAARNVAAIAMSAFAREQDRVGALAAGFDDHIAKPIDPDALVEKIAAVVAAVGLMRVGDAIARGA